MGGSLATTQRWGAWCARTEHTRGTLGLCLDEERSDLGRAPHFDYRNLVTPAPDAYCRQRALLARLIGGDYLRAEDSAGRLMSAFGSLSGVLSANVAALEHVLENSDLAARLSAARDVFVETLGENVERARFDISDASLQRWVVGLFKGLRRERVHMALLDGNNCLLSDEQIAEGCVGGVAGSLRQIVRRGIGVDASAVVLMHNHPSGDARPSQTDIDETRRIAELLGSVELRLEDHLVVAGNTIFSMRGADLI